MLAMLINVLIKYTILKYKQSKKYIVKLTRLTAKKPGPII
jgi:hypothetical protein